MLNLYFVVVGWGWVVHQRVRVGEHEIKQKGEGGKGEWWGSMRENIKGKEEWWRKLLKRTGQFLQTKN